MKKWMDKNKEIWVFTVIYSCIAMFLCAFIIGNGYVAMNGTDAIQQHYPAMIYISRWYKEFFSNLLAGHPVIRMYDYKVGMGDDVILALNYYGLGDPFYILTALIPERYMVYFYTFFFYFRVGLGGIAAIIFLRKLIPNRSCFAYVVAALLYCFCGFTHEANVHIIFVHALMYLPLLLYSVELILGNEKYGKRIMLVSIACLAMSGFFYLYVITIGIGVYALIRWIIFHKENGIPFGRLWIIPFTWILGVGSVAFLFLPSLIEFVSNPDGQRPKIGTLFVHTWEEYKNLFYMFLNARDGMRSDMAITIAGAVFIIVFITIKGYRREKLLLVALVIMYNVPIVSWFMTGLSREVYDRWEFMLVLYLVSLVVLTWDIMLELSIFQKIALVIAFILLVANAFGTGMITDRCYRNMLLAFALLLVVIIPQRLVLTWIGLARYEYVFTATIVFVVFATWFTTMGNYPIDKVEIDNKYEYVKEQIDDSVYRIEDEDSYDVNNYMSNLGIRYDCMATSAYLSIQNKNYRNTMNRDFQLYPMAYGHGIYGIGERYILQSLFSVKYLMWYEDDADRLPYGYSYYCEGKNGWNVYENDNFMPLGYTYNKVFDEKKYNSLSPFEKQNVLLESAIINDDSIDLEGYSYVDECRDICIYSDVVVIPCDDGYIVQCNGLKGFESYLKIKGIYAKNVIINNRIINVANMPGRQLFFNLGYSMNDCDIEIKIQGTDMTAQELAERLQVISYPMEDVPAKLDRLRESSFENITLKTNSFSGSINLQENRILCITVPYSKGWTAYVDGNPAKVFRMNGMWMGLNLSAGEHTVEFKYSTPYMKISLILTVVSTAFAMGWYVVLRRKTNAQNN